MFKRLFSYLLLSAVVVSLPSHLLAKDATSSGKWQPNLGGAQLQCRSRCELLFRARIGDAWLAGPVQVYLDLLRGEGRAKEMAEHLRKERLGF